MPTALSAVPLMHWPAWGEQLAKPEGFVFESLRVGQEMFGDFSFSALLPFSSPHLPLTAVSLPVVQGGEQSAGGLCRGSWSGVSSKASHCRPAARGSTAGWEALLEKLSLALLFHTSQAAPHRPLPWPLGLLSALQKHSDQVLAFSEVNLCQNRKAAWFVKAKIAKAVLSVKPVWCGRAQGHSERFSPLSLSLSLILSVVILIVKKTRF